MNIQLSAAIACGVISEPVEVGDGRRGPKGCKVMTGVIGGFVAASKNLRKTMQM